MPLEIVIDGRCLTDHFPGIGRYLFHLLQALPALDDTRVSVLTASGDGSSRFDVESLEDLGVRLYPTSAPVRGLRQQLDLPRRLAHLGAEVFHAPFFMTAYRPPCPMVIGIYDTIAVYSPQDLPSPAARLGASLGLRLAVRQARSVITLSRYAKGQLVRTFGLPPERVTVTPAAPPPDFEPAGDDAVAEVRARLSLPERYALHVGTNRPHKNLERLMEAWSEVRGLKESGCGLVFGGAHDPRHFQVDATARRLGFADVRVLGPVEEADLPALYTGAELFVLPSLTEGFGLPVLEAMACGTPVACSKSASIPEVAGHAAAYFDPEDTASIVTTLQRLLENPGYRRLLAERGRARAAQLTWKTTARLTLDVYRRAARGSAAGT